MIKLKEKIEGYNKPTPKKMRRLGDAILSAGTMFTGSAILMEEKWVAVVALLITVVGKFITNFYKED